MWEAVNTWNEKHPGLFLVLTAYDENYNLFLYDTIDPKNVVKILSIEHKKSFKSAWIEFMSLVNE